MARTIWALVASGAALVGLMSACGGNVEGETGEGGGGTTATGTTATGTTATGTTATGTTSGTTSGTTAGTTTGSGTTSCTYPSYSDNCAEVPYFECGFMATCQNGVIRADWHVHLEMECGEIVDFSCEYECPYGCAAEQYPDWPEDGAQLVDDLCAPPGSGGSGAASGSGGAAAS